MTEAEAKKPVEKVQESAQQVAKAETTSRPTRRYRTYLVQFFLLVTTSTFAMLTFLVKTTPAFPIDLAITRALQSINFPFFDTLMRLISWPGFSPQSYLLSAVVVLIIYMLGLHWEAVAALVAALLPPVVNALVKDFVQRPRPTVDLVHVFRILNSYSFPSGHVMSYVGFFGFLWFLAFTLLKKSWKRTSLLILYGALILLIGPSRIYLGQHWASDVLGAYLLGSLTLAAILQFYRWGKKRFFVRQPVAAQEAQSSD
jgi:membrane-associated phospholipid phosphatase